MRRLLLVFVASLVGPAVGSGAARSAELLAGVARADITNRDAGPVNDPLFVKALVLSDGKTSVAIVTIDAVAIAEIGSIKNDYLTRVRALLPKDLGVAPENLLVNASHCHGIVRGDVVEQTVRVVVEARRNMVPVRVGAGVGFEDRVSENRRLRLTNGKEADVRRAYSLPPDFEVAGVGPIDPTIGIVRLDRMDGKPFAVVYHFACHPIQGVPSGGNTADLVGFASKAIEESLGAGATAFFLQGCAGDINPAMYKSVDRPRDAEPLGNLLGLAVLRALGKIETKADADLKIIGDSLTLPRADLSRRIEELKEERTRLLMSLESTSLNLKQYLNLRMKYAASGEFPSHDSHRYLHERMLNRRETEKLDADNLKDLERYTKNILVMERITRTQTNLDLLVKHQAQFVAAGKPTVDVELLGVKIGDFVLVTFPGELTVQTGFNIKKRSAHKLTFVSGYTNGYIYYAPTAEQLRNLGGAQEDSDCIVAPEWQVLFESKAAEILGKL